MKIASTEALCIAGSSGSGVARHRRQRDFAAFPSRYATMFSGFCLALLLVLFCLIVRVVSFEWRSKSESPRWKAIWLWANAVGSFGAALIWGVGLADLLYVTPINSSGDFAGNLAERAGRPARDLSVAAAVAGTAFLAWTVYVAVDRKDRDVFPTVIPAAQGIAALVLATHFVWRGRGGRAFTATACCAVLWVVTLFTGLYPRVMVSSTNFGDSLTIDGASSAHYTLEVMTIAALICLPLVLLYQGWTYYVFRARVGDRPVVAAPEPPAAS